MVVDKSTGVIVPSGHWDYDAKYHNAIADGVEIIEKDLVEYKKRARRHAVQNLTIGTMVDKYLKIL
jgi:hypothetical protein